jgi:hypothetical protein
MINFRNHIYRCGPNESNNLSDEDLKDTDKFPLFVDLRADKFRD